MKLIEKDAKKTIDFTDCVDVNIGEMFVIDRVIDRNVFMKIKDTSNNISYVDLRNGNAYVAYEIMQLFREYKYAEKIDGEMNWWKV